MGLSGYPSQRAQLTASDAGPTGGYAKLYKANKSLDAVHRSVQNGANALKTYTENNIVCGSIVDVESPLVFSSSGEPA